MRLYKENKLLFFILGPFIAFILNKGLIMAPDSMGYLNSNVGRSPLYSLTANFFSNSLFLFQIAFGFFSILALSKKIKKIFHLNRFLYHITISLLFIPYIGYTGNYVLSEAIAYPLFLLAFKEILNIIFYKKNPNLYFLFNFLLLLTRGQFIFLYVFNILFSIFSRNKKIFIFNLILFLAVNISERSFNYSITHQFIPTQGFGVHFLVPGVYINNKNVDSPILKEILEKAEQKNWTIKSHAGRVNPPYHYYANFDRILFEIIYPTLQKHGFTEIYEINQKSLEFAKILISENIISYIELYLKNFSSYLGGYFNTVLFLFSALVALFRLDNKFGKLIFACSMLMFLNASALSILQSIHLRYIFYTQIPLILSYILLGAHLFYGRNRNPHSLLQ